MVPKWYDNTHALINDPDVDAVYIATPPSSHKEYTLAVAKAKKPIYVEKPMALNYEQCQAMIHACEVLNVPLFVAYYRRALPRFLKVKLFTKRQKSCAVIIGIPFFSKNSLNSIVLNS